MAVRDLCLRRWENRTVDARTVILAAALLCETERVLWEALYELTGPPRGVAQIVVAPRYLVLSIAPATKPPEWNIGDADAVSLRATSHEFGEQSGRLYQRAVRTLRRRGVDPATCEAASQELFWREPADEWTLTAPTDDEHLHPELRNALEAVQGVYAQAAAEADGLCRKERGRPAGTACNQSNEETVRWWELEERARRRLIGLIGNQRLAGL
jgi:hypothetical protein